MNFRTYITLEVTRENRTYVLSVPFGAPYEEAIQVSNEMTQGIKEMQRQQIESEKNKEQEAIVPEVVS
jgi:hypothetical protein